MADNKINFPSDPVTRNQVSSGSDIFCGSSTDIGCFFGAHRLPNSPTLCKTEALEPVASAPDEKKLSLREKLRQIRLRRQAQWSSIVPRNFELQAQEEIPRREVSLKAPGAIRPYAHKEGLKRACHLDEEHSAPSKKKHRIFSEGIIQPGRTASKPAFTEIAQAKLHIIRAQVSILEIKLDLLHLLHQAVRTSTPIDTPKQALNLEISTVDIPAELEPTGLFKVER